MGPGVPRSVSAPDGRLVVFTEWSWQHIMAARPELLDELDAILEAVARPDVREPDPLPGRERFYRRHVGDRVRWLRVVVDFNEDPAVVVTAFVQRKHPARSR
ncbi:MAG: DUF4258 domain-containing protein [Solirubrobacterales bacterium]|nr:DUF4258 domain-containing protein [Solirubrobacterales bacterium]